MQQVHGLTALLHALSNSSESLGEELSLKSIADILALQKRSGETIGRLVARFETERRFANTQGGFIMARQ